jgi:hypothetical protein
MHAENRGGFPHRRLPPVVRDARHHYPLRTFSGDRAVAERHRIFTMQFAKVYPLYVAKAEKKGRTRAEVDQIICWLTGYTPEALAQVLEDGRDFDTFFAEAPVLHPNVSKITGVVCGVRVEEVVDPLMQKIRYLDKLVDELAKGRAMEKILRA